MRSVEQMEELLREVLKDYQDAADSCTYTIGLDDNRMNVAVAREKRGRLEEKIKRIEEALGDRRTVEELVESFRDAWWNK